MIDCTQCKSNRCLVGKKNNDENCPQNKYPEILDKAIKEYNDEKIREIAKCSSMVEAMGYCEWPRLIDIIEFANLMNYKRIGIACCVGLKNEAKEITKILKNLGFEVSVVMCKVGGLKKSDIGIEEEFQNISKTGYIIGSIACNPIAQALILNEENTEMNIIVGLCVGHDMLFTKYSNAPVTTLIAKDRRLQHNPASILYTPYGRNLIQKYLSQKIG